MPEEATVDCSPAALINAARCLDCQIPVGIRDAVLIYLLAVKAGVSTDAQSLINSARPIDCCVPVGIRQAIIAKLICVLVDQAGG